MLPKFLVSIRIKYLTPLCYKIAGVHATENALHVDLMSRNSTHKPYEPHVISRTLNTFMKKLDVDIRFVEHL